MERLLLSALACVCVASCTSSLSSRPAADPDRTRTQIAKSLPPSVRNADGWAVDIFAAFEALGIEPSAENTCAVVAVTAQESTFQVNPPVPGLGTIARKEIDARAARYGIPRFAVSTALALDSPAGPSYAERIDRVTTEKELSDIFEDFIGMVPLGRKLFADWNPVRTGGPMQVSIAYAEAHAKAEHYPYPIADTIRGEVFTRRGGMYFGIAHLLDYPMPYEDKRYAFADYNAGHYASRNAAFQNALNIATRAATHGRLALDGDLLRHGDDAATPSNTELAARKLATRVDLSEREIRRDLERGEDDGFERTKLYERAFELAEKAAGKPLPRAVVPKIKLASPKITRQLTTEWFANRVNDRYESCLARALSSGHD
jgi:hypothetical protein